MEQIKTPKKEMNFNTSFAVIYFTAYFIISFIFLGVSIHTKDWAWYYSFFLPMPFGYLASLLRNFTIYRITDISNRNKKNRLFGSLMFGLKYIIYLIPVIFVSVTYFSGFNWFNIYSTLCGIMGIIIIIWIHIIYISIRKEDKNV